MTNPKDMSDDELRVATAVEVMGWTEDRDHNGALWGFRGDDAPWGNNLDQWHPERDWSAAIAAMTEAVKGTEWGWVIMGGDGDDEIGVDVGPVERVVGAAPRAICEAAVLAVRAKGESK